MQGWDDAAAGVAPLSREIDYLRGFREGLLQQIAWADEALREFDRQFSFLATDAREQPCGHVNSAGRGDDCPDCARMEQQAEAASEQEVSEDVP